MYFKGSLLPVLLIPAFLFLSPCGSVQGAPSGGYSQKRLVETARDHQWSINFHKSRHDTVHIMAFMVEFEPDTSYLTTGNGRFEMRGGGDKEKDEFRWYHNSNDTVYKFDDHPHDSLYFINQLETVAQYYKKVSRGKLVLKYSVYCSGPDGRQFTVPNTLPKYSPGGKKKGETLDQYYERKSTGQLRFSRDALMEVGKGGERSPFSALSFNAADSTIRDESNIKTVFLVFHAGSTYFTDARQDSEADMYDVFITPDFFKYYRDSLQLTRNGVLVQGKNPLLIDELMICSETANQDSLNCGIQGILVNQVARQLGIPDLWSSGSGVGGFCIMDIGADYNGNGFIPPYPSAWVRAFMGWDRPRVAPVGMTNSYSVKALSSVLNQAAAGLESNDTTILLVPINANEYYLIENRQRNLSGNGNLFNYDTADSRKPLSPYPFHVNLDSVLTKTTGPSRTVTLPDNNDIGLPASGVLVWHVDENIIRQRLRYNLVNIDSTFKGVTLVEADGVFDISVKFQNILGEEVHDFGGAEDVFPHETVIDSSKTVTINGFGPYTRPSTRSNDGGHSWIKLQFIPKSSIQKEYSVMMRGAHHRYVSNISDSVFTVRVQWDYLVPSWPKRAAPEDFFEPVTGNFDPSTETPELVVVSKTGKIYAWSADTLSYQEYNRKLLPIDRIDLKGDTLRGVDTIGFLDSLSNIIAMPSVVANRVFLPSRNGYIFSMNSLSPQTGAQYDTIRLGAIPSSYICNYRDSSWAVGCANGVTVFGKSMDTVHSVKLSSDSSVNAIASLNGPLHTIAIIQGDGTLSLCTEGKGMPDLWASVPGIGPYTLVTGDLDRDSALEIVVSDSRHGLWVYELDLKLALGWTAKPSDWPSTWTYIDTSRHSADDRKILPVNYSAPALADLDKDGHLDIVISGTNGVYAFNYKGVLLDGWPAYLDPRYWYQRGSIRSSPAIVTGPDREPLVLFSSATGENITFRAAKVIKADMNSGTAWFYLENGTLDSITGFTRAQMDTILNLNDSLLTHEIMPGGLIDALTRHAKRPSMFKSGWPQTTGSPVICSPLLVFMDQDRVPDLIAVSSEGWVYRWELAREILPDSIFWPMPGYDNGRSFTYGGGVNLPVLIRESEPIRLFSYPNPARGVKNVNIKYQFSGPATGVRLDIFSLTGFVVYSKKTMGNPPGELTGSYPGWNEHNVSVEKFGPGVYRCRLEATVNGKKHSRFWKMAVIK